MSETAERLIKQLEQEASLLEPTQIRERFELLDCLDVLLGESTSSIIDPQFVDQQSVPRLMAVRASLEAMNEQLCQSVRVEIQQGSRPELFSNWLGADDDPKNGLSFDFMDEVVSGVLAITEPDPRPPHPPEGMVFYQPTVARHIFSLLRLTQLNESDVLIDLGSGLGHVPLLASICTGARAIGIEREAAYIHSAQEAADALNLKHVSFVEGDARSVGISLGTVFYLYTPFTGTVLAEVLKRLRCEAASRPLRICTFGPCTETVAKEKWLAASAEPHPDSITVFTAYP